MPFGFSARPVQIATCNFPPRSCDLFTLPPHAPCRLQQMLPILYAKHPKETMGILGAMHGKTAEEVAEMDFTETAAMMDKDTLDSLFAFFTFALRLGCIM